MRPGLMATLEAARSRGFDPADYTPTHSLIDPQYDTVAPYAKPQLVGGAEVTTPARRDVNDYRTWKQYLHDTMHGLLNPPAPESGSHLLELTGIPQIARLSQAPLTEVMTGDDEAAKTKAWSDAVGAVGGASIVGGGLGGFNIGRKMPAQAFANDTRSAAGGELFQKMLASRELDGNGFYSQALETAKAIPQAKGTAEQMLAAIKKGGTRDSEIAATGAGTWLAGQGKSVSRDDFVKYLRENRTGLNEVVRGGRSFDTIMQERRDNWSRMERGEIRQGAASRIDERLAREADAVLNNQATKFSHYTLDPSNPTYRETVLHLPAGATPEGDFQSGHFPEPNIVGHTMTSQVNVNGKPTTLLDQIQSDWGQKLRDGGARDEAKIAELKVRDAKAQDELKAMLIAMNRPLEGTGVNLSDLESFVSADLDNYFTKGGGIPTPAGKKKLEILQMFGGRDAVAKASQARQSAALIRAELRTAEASAAGHPLVNTTDQWLRPTLHNALRMAAQRGDEHVAVPSGKTVRLNYNPGDEHGMSAFYDQIVPKALQKILQKIDPETPKPFLLDQVSTPSKGMAGNGFSVFQLTPAAREHIVKYGVPLYANAPQAAAAVSFVNHPSQEQGSDTMNDPNAMPYPQTDQRQMMGNAPMRNNPGFMQRLQAMKGQQTMPSASGGAIVSLMSTAQRMGIETQGRQPMDVAAELWSKAPTPEVGKMIEMAGLPAPHMMQPGMGASGPMPSQGGGIMPGSGETMPPQMMMRR